MAQRQVETGLRNVMEDDHNGHRIHVVSSYSIVTDDYPFHVYAWKLSPDGRAAGPREALLQTPGHAASLEEAYEVGFAHARRALDAR